MKKFLAILLCLTVFSPAINLHAAKSKTQDGVKTISYDEALKMARSNLTGLLSLDEGLKQTKATRDELQKQLDMLRRSAQNMNIAEYEALADLLEANIFSIDLQIQQLLSIAGGDATLMQTEIELLKAHRDELQAQHTQLAAAIGGLKVSDQSIDTMQNTIDIINKNMDSLTITKDILRATIDLSLRGLLTAIASTQMDVQMLEASIRINEESLAKEQLRYQRGLMSGNDIRAAEHSLNQEKLNLDTLKISLNSQKQSLNKLLKQPILQETIVEYSRGWDALPENMAKYIEQVNKNDPTIKQQQLTVDIKKLELKLKEKELKRKLDDKTRNKDQSKSDSLQLEYEKAVRERDNARTAVDAANRDLDDAKRNMEAAIYAHVNTMKQLEMRETSLQADLEQMLAQQKIMETTFNLGQITSADLEKVTLGVLKLELDLEKNTDTLWLQYFRFWSPYLL